MSCVRRLPIAAGAGCLLAAAVTLLAAPAPPERLPKIDKLSHKGYAETIPGTEVSFDMVAVPGGTFLRGSPDTETDRGADEGPQHAVKLGPLWVGRCEVTWDEFDAFAKEEMTSKKKPDRTPAEKDADAITRPTPSYIDETRGFGREGYPVIGVTHHAAMEYCRWLSAKTGRAYRLPTEAEWEWLCRAGTTTPYFFADEPALLGDYAWYEKNAEEVSHPVGKKKANPWGLRDVFGNAAEWCLDHYNQEDYAVWAKERLTVGPVHLATVNRWPHTTRGGSYLDRAGKCRSAARRPSDPKWQKSDPQQPKSIWWLPDADFVGFRVVRAVEEQENLMGLRSRVTKESK
jgi:formylglycine-generating enzyme required for sulfatase activity